MKRGVRGTGLCTLLALVSGLAQAQDTPRFRAGVDVLPIDVTVVDGQGRPVTDLTAADFRVFVDGAPRRVVSAEWISLAGGPEKHIAPAAPPAPPDYSTNGQATGGRLIVLAIDQPNIRFGGGRAITDAILRFIDHLSPSDRIALVAFGRGTASIPFTADHDRVKQSVARINGQMQTPIQSPMSGVGMSLTSAIAIERGDRLLLERLLQSCPLASADPRQAQNAKDTCEADIFREAAALAQAAMLDRDTALQALTDVLNSLKTIDAPKSLVLISEGFALSDADGDATPQLAAVGQLATVARTTIYALRLADQVFDVTRANRAPGSEGDTLIRTEGLETLTSAARGTMFTVTTTGEAAFERIESELSGYYVLGLEASAADRTPSPMRVEVARSGATVRARRTLVAPFFEPDAASPSPVAAAAAALTRPMATADIPLRVISFNLQGPDPSKVQVLIHADVGQEYSSPQTVAVAYFIADSDGRVIDTGAVTERLAPPAAGVPSSLPFVAGAAVAPGDYILKLAVTEGGKVGSVQHAFRASLGGAGAVKLSDLIVGAPLATSGAAPLRPSVGYTVQYGVVHGYLEAYGAAAAAATVKYEVAADDKSPALISEIVPARAVNESRVLFSKVLSTVALPPGRYLLRAVVSPGGAPARTISRPFEVAAPVRPLVVAPAPSRPAAADVNAAGTGRDATAELYLPIESGVLAAPFDLAEALGAETLQRFASLVPPAAKPRFDEGITHLRNRNWVSAENSFKRAFRPDTDFTAALTYLAATFAASGHDMEAASAWQTALVGGGSQAQIYWWLGNALLRVREFARAKPILEEAALRWPADARFARPLAMLYATTGKGLDALPLLQRYLNAHGDDVEALYLGVQWTYEIHLNGGASRVRAADVALARKYAEQYARLNGPRQPLVNQWLDYLSK